MACSNYPKCKYIKKSEQAKAFAKCPKCGHDIVARFTKKGKVFYGCSNFPKCNFASWYEPTGEVCPNCNSILVIKNKVITCEECGYEK